MRIKRYEGFDNIKNEDQFLEDYLFAGALLRFVAELPGEIQWFIKECIEDEDGVYHAIFHSYACPEYRNCVLSIKVEPNADAPPQYIFRIQKQVTR